MYTIRSHTHTHTHTHIYIYIYIISLYWYIVAYWRYIIHYTNLLIHNGMASVKPRHKAHTGITYVEKVQTGKSIRILLQFRTWQAMHVQCNIQARSRNYYFRGKAISITYSEQVFVASVIRHVKHMWLIIQSPVACLSLPCISILYHERLCAR